MKLADSSENRAAIKILVSREGIATVSASPIIVRIEGACALRPVFGLTPDCSSRHLGESRDLVDIAFDQGEWIISNHHAPIEGVELDSKIEPAISRVAHRLAADAYSRQMSSGKVAQNGRRAREERSSAHAASNTHIPDKMIAIEAFHQVVQGCLTQVAANAEFLRSASNREALHQLRVGLRRLRAAFTAFESILPRAELDRWQHETKWLAGELDAARDIDVFIMHMSRSRAANSDNDVLSLAFGERLLLAQAVAYDLALTAIDSDRFASLLQDCTQSLEATAGSRDDNELVRGLRDGDTSVLAAQALAHLHHQLRKAGDHLTTLGSLGRHRARIKAKKLRYAAEFFGETFGKGKQKRRSRYIASLTTLQDALGGLNDLATARRCALAVVGRNVELAFHAGQVVGGRDKDEPRLLAEARRAYEHWSSAKRFWV
jgi:triphosphatase